MTLKRKVMLLLVIITLTLSVKADLSTLHQALKKDLTEAQQYYNYMEKAYYSKDILAAKKDLDMAISLAEQVETEGEGLLRQSRIKLEEFWVNVSYSLPATTKMAYISAEELTRKALARDISAYVHDIKELGFNGIAVETMRKDGYTLFPTKDQEQYRLLQGTDVLKELSNIAKDFEIELFLVMDIGFAARDELPLIVAKYPDWVAVSESGEIFDEMNNVYLNVSHPEVRKYYVGRAKDLADYNISGLILKIDPPKKAELANDYSYDVYSRSVFEQQYGYDPLKVKDRSRVEWNEWRIEQINSLLSQIALNIEISYPQVKLGATVILEDIFLDDLRYEKLIDWERWLERKYISYFLPQISSAKEYDDMLKDLNSVKGNFLPYPVYVWNDDISVTEFLQSISKLQLSGGFIFSDIDKLDQFTKDMLARMLTKRESVSLHDDPWRALMLNMTEIEAQAPQSWANDIRQFTDKLSKLVMAQAGSSYIGALSQARNHLEYLKVKTITDSSLFAKRMECELIFANHLLELGASSRTLQGKKLY
ncbi:MAG: family 10 glycosylhydrolase [Firmicutes bacterium]|nr:family 10 glycosylhydrolase [Bacillota bacterium]MDD4263960.1 family 10 glycosylhydrolase [Bacillota bacterium]MDD4693579.1 family 10 glycosylhydrolase [Bacillota bacterium]